MVNHIPKGVYFLQYAEDGTFLVTVEDYASLGLPPSSVPPVEIDGTPYIPLWGQQYLTVTLDEATLILEIDIEPSILPETRIDLANQSNRDTKYPLDKSLIINYDLSQYGARDAWMAQTRLGHDLAVRTGPVLFQSEHDAYATGGTIGWTRYLSRFVWENRTRLLTAVAGDHYAYSNGLGSPALLGGVGIARDYIDPYYVSYPTARFTGAAQYPTEAEIYVDGALVRREDIPPGPFAMENLTRFEGAGEVSVLLRDDEGKEVLLSQRFYQSTRLLKPDTHEFSYSTGFLREDYGTRNFAYGLPAFTAFHRYGVNDSITAGLASEIDPHFVQVSPGITFKTGLVGEWDLAIAQSYGEQTAPVWSPDEERTPDDGYIGNAASAEYSYRQEFFSAGAKVAAFTEEYGRLWREYESTRPALEASARLSVGIGTHGSISLAAARLRYYIGEDRDVGSVSYGGHIAAGWTVSASLEAARDDHGNDFAGQISILYYPPDRKLQFASSYREDRSSREGAVGVESQTPFGEGAAGSLDFEWKQTDHQRFAAVPAGLWKSPWATFRGKADLAIDGGDFSPSYEVSAAGAMVWMGSVPHFGRPVTDSFALIKVADVENVQVYRNSTDMGRTNKRGIALIPEMDSHYDNQVGVRDEDVPMEYAMGSVMEFVSPPSHGGACVVFGTTKIQPLVGHFILEEGDQRTPLEFLAYTVTLGNAVLETQTALDGEFYIDMTEVGDHQAVKLDCSLLRVPDSERAPEPLVVTFDLGEERRASVTIQPPKSDELYVDLGEIVLRPDASP